MSFLANVILFGTILFGYYVVDAAKVTGSATSMAARQSQLLKTLLNDSYYDYRVAPKYNDTHAINVGVRLVLIKFVNLHGHQEVMETFVYFEQVWHDFRLKWDPSSYGRVSYLYVPANQVWQPDLTVFNGAEVGMETMQTFVNVLQDGLVYYSPKVRLLTHCSLNLLKFPYDTQTCTIKLGSFMYLSSTVNLTHAPETTPSFHEFYADNREWEIKDMSTEIVTQVFQCCNGESFQQAHVTFTVKRNSWYYTNVFVLPAVILAILVPFQFILPPNCKERLTIGSTILLGCLVIIFMIQTYLPDGHPNLPYIVQYYCLTMLWTAVSLLCSMWIINTQEKGRRNRQVPAIIKQVFLSTLRRFVCLSEDAYTPLNEFESMSLRSLEKQVLLHHDIDKHEANKLEKDVEDILRHVSVLVHAVAGANKDAQSEWYLVAIVFDRIMCFLFTVIFVVYSCVLLG